VTLRDQLEMHLYNGRERGWCLTQKLALRDVHGQVIGMAGISHDLQEAHARIRRGSGWRSSTIISVATTTGRSPWKS
jgi:hypothetical protein